MSEHEIYNEMECMWERIFSDLLDAYLCTDWGTGWATFVEMFREVVNNNLKEVCDTVNFEEE